MRSLELKCRDGDPQRSLERALGRHGGRRRTLTVAELRPLAFGLEPEAP
jgi:hypothetical protein